MKCSKFLTVLTSLTMTLVLGGLPTAQAQIFTNAVRSDGQPGDGKGIVSLRIASANNGWFSCTAFFLKNDRNRAILMTARHCSAFKLAQSCKAGLVTLTTQEGAFKGVCKKSLIENKELDETVIEAVFPNWETEVLPRVSFYSLSSQHPQPGTRLEMMGYPADPIRHGAFTVTRNCWISTNRMVTVNDYPQQSAELLAGFAKDWAGTKVVITRNTPSMSVQQSNGPSPLTFLTKRFAAYHNCSVYGGNSGGPIAIEGTQTVLGLPTSFFPNVKVVQPENLTTTMDATADFVERNNHKLRSLGVEVVQPYAYGN